MQLHGSKYFARSPPTPDPRVKRSNLTFAEHDHVAYQIKGNSKCSNMVANILPAAPSPLRRSKFNFSEHGHAAHILAANPLSPPLSPCGQKSTCSEHGRVAYQIKGNTNAAAL